MRFRNKNILVLFMLIVITIAGIVFTNIGIKDVKSNDKKIKIVTSFYPMYIATLNIVSDIDSVELSNLTQPQTGCLHDYQLTPQDMIKLETADVLIINGGGMESFIEDIINKYPDITIINASESIEFLESEEHNHLYESHKQEENNAHVWVSITNYIKQIENIQKGLINFDNTNKETYLSNAENYISDLKILNQNMKEQLKDVKNKEVIIFHDSFAYIAQELGLDVKHTVVMESDTSLSAGEIAEVIDEINEYNIKVLFTEEQYSKQIASSVANETSAKVYVLDSCVSGVSNKNAYIDAMEKNLKILEEALN